MPENAGQLAVTEQQGVYRQGFQPGVSGNPKGRPRKAESLTNMLWEVADEDSTEPGKSRIRVVVERLFDRAESTGKQAQDATEEILNRLLGRPVQAVNVSGEMDDEVRAMIQLFAGRLAPTTVIEAETRVIEPES